MDGLELVIIGDGIAAAIAAERHIRRSNSIRVQPDA